MASTLKHLRSSSADKRPTASGLADGQLAINTASGTPGLFFKDSNNTIVKVGPAHVDATAPNATPAGSAGNSKGEFWVDINLVPSGLKVWNGSAFSNLTPSGSETIPGLLEVATPGEVQAGTDHQRAVTPSGLQSKISDSTSTTSSTTIASSTAVKSAYDLANAALPKTGGTVTGELLISPSGSLVFEGSTDDGFETTLAVTNPTADRTITFPNVTGTVVTTGDSGTVTSTMIADGTIVNADINASAAIAYGKLALASGIVDSDISGSAEIAVSKLADGAARQLLQTDAAGTGVEWASNIDIPGTLDVTSAATFDSSATIAGDLTVDTSTLKVDSTNNRVGIGTASPGALLELGTATPILRFSDTDTTGYHQIQSSNANFIINADPSNADASSSISFNVDGSERARIDSSGRLLVGTSTARDNLFGTSTAARTAVFQTETSGAYRVAASFVRNNTDTGGGDIVLGKSRGTTAGSYTIVNSGDTTGNIYFMGADGAALVPAAGISAAVEATPGLDSMPGRLVFSTATNASPSVVTERMRIDSAGRLLVGVTSTSADSRAIIQGRSAGSTGNGVLYLARNSSPGTNGNPLGTLNFSDDGHVANAQIEAVRDGATYTSGSDQPAALTFSTTADGTATLSERVRIDSSGNVGIGTTSPTVPLAVAKDGTTGPTGITGTSTTAFFSNTAATRGIGINYDSANVTAGIFSLGTNSQLCFYTPTTATYAERMRIDNSGRLLVGTSSARSNGVSSTYNLLVESPTYGTAVLASNANNASTGGLYFVKSRGAANGGTTVVQSGDGIGRIAFSGTDGSNPIPAAYIDCAVDGTPGANDMPGRLVFSTTANGASAPTEAMRIDSSGRLLVGTTSSRTIGTAAFNIQTEGASTEAGISSTRYSNNTSGPNFRFVKTRGTTAGSVTAVQSSDSLGTIGWYGTDGTNAINAAAIEATVDSTPGTNDMPGRLMFYTTADGASTVTERMRITNDGRVYVNTTDGTAPAGQGSFTIFGQGSTISYRADAEANTVGIINRNTDDGVLISLRQANTQEGSISVSGTTVSYNGAHLSRWSQLPGGQEREEILRGTVLSNIDEMCEWDEEDNEQLNRMKVSDVEGDKNVSGVFQCWDDDDDTYTDDFYCAMTGDFIIRIAENVTVERGDLLMSAGDGTAKPQDDDIIRSKTIAKVTSTHVSCTYEDGSYCVPCVLMAC